MTDGGRESVREPQIDHKRTACGPSSSSIDQFSHALAKIAVAQILESADFCCSYRAPIDTLAGVMVRYISHIGKLAASHANSSNRIACNVFDVIHALEEIESMHGFVGQSDINRCLGNSSVIKDLYAFVGTEREIPFARSNPRFPVVKDSKIQPSFREIGKENTGDHIPPWLPAFPDAKMYVNDLNYELKEEEKKKQERSFFSLQKLFGSSGSDESPPVMETGTKKGKQVVPNNPFLVPPFPFGEREVSQVSTGTAGKISVIESFKPVIEASKEEEKSEIEAEERFRGEISCTKPLVRFRIGVSKKSVANILSVKDESTEKDLWFEKGDEMNVKKMRAELILKESMEDPNKLAQL